MTKRSSRNPMSPALRRAMMDFEDAYGAYLERPTDATKKKAQAAFAAASRVAPEEDWYEMAQFIGDKVLMDSWREERGAYWQPPPRAKRSSKRTSKRGVRANHFFFPEEEEGSVDPKVRVLRILDESLDASKTVISLLKSGGNSIAVVDAFHQSVLKYHMGMDRALASKIGRDPDVRSRLDLVQKRGEEASRDLAMAISRNR